MKLLSKLNHQNIVRYDDDEISRWKLATLLFYNDDRYYSTWTEQIPINDQRKSPAKVSTTSSPIPVKKKLTNGDSLRHQLPGTIPDLSSSNEFLGNPTDSSESSSSSTPSSDDEDGVFDTRWDWNTGAHLRSDQRFLFFLIRNYSHIDDSDDMIEFDRECNQGEVHDATLIIISDERMMITSSVHFIVLLFRSRKPLRVKRN